MPDRNTVAIQASSESRCSGRRLGQRRRVGDAHDVAGGTDRGVLTGQDEQPLAARADVGGDGRHAGREARQQHRRRRLADRAELDRPDLRQDVVHPL
jgi:hypothetical protein